MKRILLIFGTRPEAIKMCPLVNELKRRVQDFEVAVCVSGQHKEMLKQVLDVFDVVPDYDLAIMRDRQTLFDITNMVLSGVKSVLADCKPDIVLVHGDTTTSFAAALACFYMHIPVGHVEAGLRTYDIDSPWPEEFNRQAVDSICRYHFAPTQIAADNLIREGKCEERVFVTGNTGIDALQTTVSDSYRAENLDWVGDDKLILVTAHRRENLGEPMRHMFRAIKRVVEEHLDIKVIYPIHLNPIVREIADEELKGSDRIRIIEPLEVIDFHNYMNASYLILTDSGGIQEEAPSLGKPVLVMRDTTERPEGLAAGTLKLVGTDTKTIYEAFTMLLEDNEEYIRMSRANNPYGDGRASMRIADLLLNEKIV
ncbi:MAG: UDP-N-acetylglucosamine 2-epimerase (non-hydrolyzing) [Eggerthellaceae bacterium]|nr:UDP-N-acetylglucosamine 2-epimerase (non-hydrolyzing) [Eggerthellaceae bacterium]